MTSNATPTAQALQAADAAVLTFTSKPKDENEARIVLFEIDGEQYSIPAKPRANIGLKYLRDLRTKGENLATANLLSALLGEDGFDALAEYEDLTTEDMAAVTELAQKAVFGQLEEASKN